jgi:hypothetical protein
VPGRSKGRREKRRSGEKEGRATFVRALGSLISSIIALENSKNDDGDETSQKDDQNEGVHDRKPMDFHLLLEESVLEQLETFAVVKVGLCPSSRVREFNEDRFLACAEFLDLTKIRRNIGINHLFEGEGYNQT